MKYLAGFVVGWLCALVFATHEAGAAIEAAKAGKTHRCMSGDSIWTRKKYLCDEAEFKARAAKAAEGGE